MLLVALLAGLAAAAPATFQHQGRLIDSGTGLPLDGPHTLGFALYDSVDGPAPLWAEDVPVDAIAGFYAATLGETVSIDPGLLDGDALWLGLSVDGGPELPRLPLASVPWALQARDLIGGVVDAVEIRVGGEVVIDGSGTFVGDSSDTLAELPCAPGEVAVYDGADWVCAPLAGSPAWDDLLGVPAELLDGDDDLLAGLGCAPGDVTVFDGFRWTCAPLAIDVAWEDLVAVPAELLDGDADTLADLGPCPPGAVATWDGAAWRCTAPSADWSSLSGVPADLLDGDADSLGALGCDAGDQPVWDGARWLCAPAVASWGELVGVPVDLLDGDGDTLADLSCLPGEYAVWDGVGWRCEPADAAVLWSEITGVPAELADGDADTLAELGCAPGEYAGFDGVGWACFVLPDGATWDTLPGVPADLLDGDADSFAGVTCGPDEVLVSDGIGWGCAVLELAWSALDGIPADLLDGDADTLAGLPCSEGEVARVVGGLWSCAAADDPVLWGAILGVPADILDGDADSWAGVSCGDGQQLIYDADLDRWDCFSPSDGDSLADLGLLCEDGEIPRWVADEATWVCAPDAVLAADEVIAIVDGAVLSLGAGSTIGGAAPATVEAVLEALDSDGLGEGALPFNGLDEVSNGLLTNQFVSSIGAMDIPIPDNNPVGVDSVLPVASVGVAEWIEIDVALTNSDLTGVVITLTDPDGAVVTLFERDPGVSLDETWPTTRSFVSGDLDGWVGRDPAGDWTLTVVDDLFLDNTFDGQVDRWAIRWQTVSDERVRIEGTLEVADDLTLDADLYVAGSARIDGSLSVGGPTDLADVVVSGGLQLGVDPADCTPEKAGTMQWADDSLKVCTGVLWVDIPLALDDGRDPATPGRSCKDILAKYPDSPTGAYWLRPTGHVDPFQAWCEMDLDGGGWTVLANNDNTDTEPAGCYARIASDGSLVCGDGVTASDDHSVPAWNIEFEELLFTAHGGDFGATEAYQYMTWPTPQTIPESGGAWHISGDTWNVTLDDWSAASIIQCTYAGIDALKAVGNRVPFGGGDYAGQIVTLFTGTTDHSNYQIGFTEYTDWSPGADSNMQGLDDFQDGWGCGDDWAPHAARGSSAAILVR